jgi:hypothetical protein
MRASPEFSIDLTAQDLLSLPMPMPAPAAPQIVEETAVDDTVEIELTAAQMDAMLSAK